MESSLSWMRALSESRWESLTLAAQKGAALRAQIWKENEKVICEISEGGQTLVKLIGKGAGAREVIASWRAVEGIWESMLGAEQAWEKAIETLASMSVREIGVGAPSQGPLGLPADRVKLSMSPREKTSDDPSQSE